MSEPQAVVKMLDQAPSEALEVALEVLMPNLRSNSPQEQVIAAKCIGLMAGYDTRWRGSNFTIESVESVVSSELFNPETQSKSRTFKLSGKLDITARDSNGRRVIFDHKSTSEDITDPNGTYWRQLAIEGQVDQYLLLEHLNARRADYALWDVIRKPSIRPSKLTKKEREAVVFDRMYCGQILSADQIDEFQAGESETPIMYAARLTQDAIQERPQWYYQRRAVVRTDAELLDYAREVWDHSQDIILARRNNRHPRNSGACILYKSPCKFLGICSGYDSADSGNWTQRKWVHNELPVLQGNGKDILTNSRIRTFQTCRRKHYLQYEVGLERIEEEEREALLFGATIHQALEAYFLTLKKEQS